uniref:Uncharacterized protein n=1 Tax=Rhizophora mucronata TaxID=61149 RepID=A0A2P2NMB4_RHIMU
MIIVVIIIVVVAVVIVMMIIVVIFVVVVAIVIVIIIIIIGIIICFFFFGAALRLFGIQRSIKLGFTAFSIIHLNHYLFQGPKFSPLVEMGMEILFRLTFW